MPGGEEVTKIKALRRPERPLMRVSAGPLSEASNFFSDFKAATIELQRLSKGNPLASRLVSENAVRRLREKISV